MDSNTASMHLEAIQVRSSIRRKTLLVNLLYDHDKDNSMNVKIGLNPELKLLESNSEQEEKVSPLHLPLLSSIGNNLNSMQYKEHVNKLTIIVVKFVLLQVERKIFQSISNLREILIRTSIISLPQYLQQFSVRYIVMDIIERLKHHEKLLCCSRLNQQQQVFVSRTVFNEYQSTLSHNSTLTVDSNDTVDTASNSSTILSYDKAQCANMSLRKLARQKIWSLGMKTDEKTLIEVADVCDYFSRLSKMRRSGVTSSKVKSAGIVNIDLYNPDCVHIINVYEYTNRELYLIKEVVTVVLANML